LYDFALVLGFYFDASCDLSKHGIKGGCVTWHNEVIDLLENTELDFSKPEHKVHRRLADFGVHKYG
jgi:hypothetical protein